MFAGSANKAHNRPPVSKVKEISRIPVHKISKSQALKSGFSKIEQNSDLEKTTKTPEHERTENSSHFALLNSKIGLETMEISYINDK